MDSKIIPIGVGGNNPAMQHIRDQANANRRDLGKCIRILVHGMLVYYMELDGPVQPTQMGLAFKTVYCLDDATMKVERHDDIEFVGMGFIKSIVDVPEWWARRPL